MAFHILSGIIIIVGGAPALSRLREAQVDSSTAG